MKLEVNTYMYHPNGQLARAKYVGNSEEFLWDGLALVRRNDEHFINEPHVGGGNPVVSSKGTSYFNDMLGTTIGSKSNGKYSAAALTAFGERLDNADGTSPAIRSLGEGWFTGKPFVEGLGHTFLMRNYRAGLAKWQTADPLGYPDGWNQLAYCGNSTVYNVDVAGTLVTAVYSISQKTLTITDDDTHATVTVLNVISGDNNLSHQWKANIGPLPIGEYTILDHGGGHANWYELWKNDGWFDDYTTGPNGVKRGNFRLHPGSFSLGCITMPAEDVNTIAALALISKTKTETIHPASQMFSSKVKYGILSVVE
jgi:RHS repeat-associated protein